MARRQRNPALERQWRERLASWASSGLSVREFCGQWGLTEPRFYYWKRELRSRDAAAVAAVSRGPASQGPVTKSSPPTFVPVTVLSDTVLSDTVLSDTVLARATVSVEVRCPSGHVVLLSSCAAVDLAALFAALAPRAPLAREARPC